MHNWAKSDPIEVVPGFNPPHQWVEMRDGKDLALKTNLGPSLGFKVNGSLPSAFAWSGLRAAHSPMRSEYRFDGRDSRDQ
jgi:hypothetical protein